MSLKYVDLTSPLPLFMKLMPTEEYETWLISILSGEV